MTRRAFFSFHYKNDVWRANIVRNSWVLKDSKIAAGFVDAADFEDVKQKGDAAIREWINGQLYNTSVTVVLIGSETNQRDYIKYELRQSYARGNGLLGIYIHGIKNQDGETSIPGSNQFGEIGKDSRGNPVYFSISFPTYNWVDDDGYNNMGTWIEEAAKAAGK